MYWFIFHKVSEFVKNWDVLWCWRSCPSVFDVHCYDAGFPAVLPDPGDLGQQ
jgi:hypothetical protein